MNQKNILLCTLNSTYQHTAFGLRYLYANLDSLQPQAHILEWTIKENPRQIVQDILTYAPKIVGFGVYIWNTDEIYKVVSLIKTIRPDICIVLGGPEISYETMSQHLYNIADYVITGEADFSFRDFCEKWLNNEKPAEKIIRSNLPEITAIKLPYAFYSEDDIKNRLLYVEASRGCPYRCEYCLSSLDKSVRNFNIDQFLIEMRSLIDKGVRTFKFVDRTFNLSPTISTQILRFFLEHKDKNLFLHFEMVPDRLPQEIKDLIIQFPEGCLQFEVGIQTLNPVVASNVSRKNDLNKVKDNFDFIKNHTHVHTHADLIVGLPGETLESFGQGFDQLHAMGPDEIQVGILKRLKGTPITQREKAFEMKYQSFPPFQILSNSTMDFSTLQTMNKFAKYWDLYANSGEFKNFVKVIHSQPGSFFWNFMSFVNFMSEFYRETHSISLMNLAEKAWLYMKKLKIAHADDIIEKDFCYGHKRRDIPPFLKKGTETKQADQSQPVKVTQFNTRQTKHTNESSKKSH